MRGAGGERAERFEFFGAGHLFLDAPPRAERVLSRVLITPTLHRRHHIAQERELDTNFGTIFSLWDRAARTLRRSARGRLLAAVVGQDSVLLSYEGLDGLLLTSALAFSIAPTRLARDCAELELDLGYLSRLLQSLRRQGVVQGEAAKEDARRVRLSLTARGRKVFQMLDARSRDLVAEMLGKLGAPDQSRLVGALQAVESVLEKKDSPIVLRAHQPVETAQGAGVTTSGTYSPTLLASIALARVPPGTAAGAAVKVQVRDKWLAARTVKSPFVRHGRSLLPELPAAP